MTPFLIINLAGLIAISILLAHYWWERRILSGFVHSSLPPSESTFGTALDLAGRIYVQVSRGSDPPFIRIAALDVVGATPVSILRRGGCCSGFARLYITGLGTLGIKAAQVTLYQGTGQYQHALAEVSMGEERVIVDLTYVFSYVDGEGGPIGLDELRRGSSQNTDDFRTGSAGVQPAVVPTKATPRMTSTTSTFRKPRPPTGPRRGSVVPRTGF